MPSDILYSQVMMNAIQNQVVRRGSFFRDHFFANTRNFRERVAQYDVIDNQVHELKFDGYNGESNSSAMNSWATAYVQFECAKPARTILPNDLMQRLPGYTAYDDANKVAELQRLSWEELEADLIYTEELLALSAIKTGKVTIKDSNNKQKDLADWSANLQTTTIASLDLSSEGNVVKWVMQMVQAVISAEGAAPNTLVVGTDIGDAIAKAFADGRRHMEDGAINPAADYANEAIAYLGNVAGVSIYVCGKSAFLGAKNAIIGSNGESIMCYGPTFVPSENGFILVEGRRSMYTVNGQDPVGMKNILQAAPVPVVRRPADLLYITATAVVG